MKASARVLAVLLIFAVPLLARVDAGSIRGQVLPAQGESDLPGVVMVRIVGIGVQQTTYVSGNFFSFDNLRDGNYTIYVSATGREEVVQDVHNFSAERGDSVSIVMGHRKAEENLPAAGNTVVDLKTLRVPEKAQEQLKKGTDFLDKGDFAKAAQHFEAAIKICPEFYQAHNNLGVARLKLNKTGDAEKEFARAVEIEPNNVIGLRNLAYIRMNRGAYREAIDPLSRAVRLEANDAKAEMYLGEAYAMEKDAANAKQHFLKAILLDPALTTAHYRLGYLFLDEKQYVEALKHFQAFLKLNPDKGKEEVQAIVVKLEQYFKDSLARGVTNPLP